MAAMAGAGKRVVRVEMISDVGELAFFVCAAAQRSNPSRVGPWSNEVLPSVPCRGAARRRRGAAGEPRLRPAARGSWRQATGSRASTRGRAALAQHGGPRSHCRPSPRAPVGCPISPPRLAARAPPRRAARARRHGPSPPRRQRLRPTSATSGTTLQRRLDSVVSHQSSLVVVTSAKCAEERKQPSTTPSCAATGSILSPFALETTGGHGASTASVYLLLTKQMRDSGLPADVLVGKPRRTSRLRCAGARFPSDYTSCPRRLTPGYACAARARPPRMRSSSLPSTDKRRAGGLGSLDSLLISLLFLTSTETPRRSFLLG
jgi:hypothetical protein